MIGLSLAQSGAVETSGDYSAFITPNPWFAATNNGSYTSIVFTATPVNGEGPFEYKWSTVANYIFIKDKDSASTTIAVSGFNETIAFDLLCEVTDMHNGAPIVTPTNTSTHVSVKFS